ncbi:MAG: hypothetical protein JWM56_780 [Candidatus Peribacteria bacterium]|nr:hypothetical protein [Candidatus Peribacteria bacterium]
MMARLRWMLVASYILALLVLAFPRVRDQLDVRNKGFALYYGTDESHYAVRLQEGLLHPFADTSNGIFSKPSAPQGLQPAGLERVAGFFFGWTGWTGTQVMILLSVLFAAVMVPLLQRLLVRTGLSDGAAFAGSALYFILFLGPLMRFVHQSWSLPCSVAALLLLWRFWERPTWLRAGIAGVFLGVLPHIYYWSWTFVWPVAALLFFASWWDKKDLSKNRRHGFLCMGIVAASLAAPYFLHMIMLAGNPLAREVAERSSVVYARGFESYTRSILVFLLAVGGYLSLRNTPMADRLRPLLFLSVVPFIVLHQQFIHGQVISFSTHYYPYICLVALLLAGALIAAKKWTIVTVPTLLLAILLLAAAGVDYTSRSAALHVESPRFRFQNLVGLSPWLASSPRQTILTDRETALILAANTKHDVVFTEHIRHVLVSTREYAERYCMSEMFAPDSHPEWVPNTLHELSRLGRSRAEELRAERLNITTDACSWVQAHKKEALQRYSVDVLVWNEKEHPDWHIDSALFTLEQQGNGWSLWKVKG